MPSAAPGRLAEVQRRSLLGPGLARQLVSSDDFEDTAWAKVHPFAAVRASWARALSGAGGPTAATHLASMVDDADVSVRAWAAFGLVLGGETGALALLVRCANSRRSEERVAAVGLLGVVPLPGAVAPVLLATSDRSPVVACAALVRCAHLGSRDGLLAIAEQLDHSARRRRRARRLGPARVARRGPRVRVVGPTPHHGERGGGARRSRATHELWAPETRYVQGAR